MLQLTTYQTGEEGGDSEKKNDGSAGSGKNRNVQGKRKGEITLSGSMTRQVRSFLSVLSLFLSFFFLDDRSSELGLKARVRGLAVLVGSSLPPIPTPHPKVWA